ncbi:MAG: hypothetical protein AAE983_03685 [Thermoplasmataceae archaeon]|jgi:hypothetical protein
MKLKVKYLGAIFMTASMLLLAFSGITHSAIVNNYNQEAIGDSQAMLRTASQNASVMFAKKFDSWYIKNFPGSSIKEFKNFSAGKRDSIVKKFLMDEPGSVQFLRINQNQELAHFNSLDKKMVNKTFWYLKNKKYPSSFTKKFLGANSYYEERSGMVSSILLKISPESLPNGVLFDSGMWVMVQINYFVYHAPWWLGGWSVKYGEHDVINSLYAGSSAQNFYNHVTSTINVEGILFGIALGAIATGLTFAAPTLGISTVVGGIIAAALVAAGSTAAALAYVWTSDLTSIYESTYANQPSGNKYMWMFDIVNYYYPSVTVVGSLASSIGMYGYLSNMNTITFIPNVPLVEYVSTGLAAPISGVAIAASISGTAHGIANSIGLNNWGYGGTYS